MRAHEAGNLGRAARAWWLARKLIFADTANMRQATIAIAALLIATSNLSYSQPTARPTAVLSNGVKLYAPNNGVRVGKSVLARFLSGYVNRMGFVQQVLIACDGSWVSTVFNVAVLSDDSLSDDWERQAGKSDEAIPLDPLSFSLIGESPLVWARHASRVGPELCKTAAREPRNMQVPVAITVDATKRKGQVIAVLTGTAERQGNRVDAWTRWTEYVVEDMKSSDGKPFVIDGETQTVRKAAGPYELRRFTFDCPGRQLRSYQSVTYKDQSGTVSDSFTAAREGQLTAAVPDSVGESLLEAACRLY